MAKAKAGDRVRVHYTGTLKDGTVFDSSVDQDPIEFIIGEGEVIEGFDKAVTGLEPGQSVTTEIQPPEAYGEHHDELTITVPVDQIPPDITPELDMMLQINLEGGGVAHVTVTEITEEAVTLDGNHPLAGKELTFDLSLVEIL